MLEHHIQRAIVYRLAFAKTLRFSALKPDDIESKLFTYHLQKVVKAGYAEKSEKGMYRLTLKGRQLGTRLFARETTLFNAPESVLFLVIRRASDKAWLLYRRHTYPLREQVGFMHCLPSAQTETPQTAHLECQQKTGLRGEFFAIGGGYFRVKDESGLESFTHYTLLYCDDITGELKQGDEYADYFWSEAPDFSSPEFLASTQVLLKHYRLKKPFFEETLVTITV